MKTEPWLYRCAIFAACCTLIAIIFGAIVTSLQRPIAETPAAINPAAPTFESWHVALGTLAAVMAIALAVWLAAAKRPKQVVQLGWIALAVGLVESALGTRPGILHALLGPVLFATIVCIAVMTSASWLKGPQPIKDSWHPSMRSLAIAVPAIVLLQITLGAAYRYRSLGVIWHILNAMIVLLLVLIVSIFLVRQFPEHSTLRPTAVAAARLSQVRRRGKSARA